MTGSLTQLLFYREKVIELLIKYLSKSMGGALAPLTALTATLVRDLGEELVPHFLGLFTGILSALQNVSEGDVETMEVVLGSLFFFVKNLLADVDTQLVIECLLKGLSAKGTRPQVQDFLAEFTIYVVSLHFDYVRMMLSIQQTDLLACILAGSLYDVKTKKFVGERLACVSGLLPDAHLCERTLIAMVDRYGDKATLSAVSQIIAKKSHLNLEMLSTAVAAICGNKQVLFGEERFTLLSALCGLSFSLPTQSAVVALIGRINSIGELLLLRSKLRPFLSDARGVALLVFGDGQQHLEPLVGCVQAVSIVLNELWEGKSKLVAIKIIKRILDVIPTETALAQVCSKLPIAELQALVGCENFKLAYQSMSLICQMPKVQLFPEFERITRVKPDYLSVTQWIELLFQGRILVCQVDKEALYEHVSSIKVLELLDGSSPNTLVEPSLLLPLLISTDPRRRSLVLSLLNKSFNSELLTKLQKIEAIPWTFNNDRDKGIILQGLVLELKKRTGEQSLEIESTIRYLVGVLLMGFLPIKKDIFSLMAVLVDHHSSLTRKILIEIIERLVSYEGIQEATGTAITKETAIEDLLGGIEAEIQIEDDTPLFVDNAVAPLVQFLAHKPSASELVLDTLLPICQKIFLTPEGGVAVFMSRWFSLKLQTSLADLLSALGGAKSAKHNGNHIFIIESMLFKFLAFGDVVIQKRALSCISSLSLVDGVTLFEERLGRLLDDKEIHEELVALSAEHVSLSQSNLWRNLCKLLIPILYGRIIHRKAVRGDNLLAHRKMILNYISIWDATNIHEFIKFIKPTETVPKRIIGALTLLETLINKLGRRITALSLDMLFSWFEELKKSREGNGEEDKKIRNLIIKRLLDLYRVVPAETEMQKWSELAWSLIQDKIARFEIEFTQESSAILELVHLWTSEVPHRHMMVSFGWQIFPRLAAALGVIKAKNAVVLKILNIFSIALKQNIPFSANDLKYLCESLNVRIKNMPMGMLLDQTVSLVIDVVPFVPNFAQDSMVYPLLQLVSLKHGVSEQIKTKMLQLLSKLCSPNVVRDIRKVAVNLLDLLKKREARFTLAELFSNISNHLPELTSFSQTLTDLHSPSKDCIGEYDYEKQTMAFSLVRKQANDYSLDDWVLVIKTLLFFSQDAEDVAARTHAFSILNLFLEKAVNRPDEFFSLVLKTLYPAIKKGLKNKNESVRTDFLNFLNEMVSRFRDREPFIKLVPLLIGDDEEANVLLNILHLQQHRRARALKRLAEYGKSVVLSRSIIEGIFFPLLVHFVFSDPTARDPTPPLIVHGAIIAMATLHAHLPSKILVKKTLKYAEIVRKGTPAEKAVIRLIAECFKNIKGLTEELSKPVLNCLFELLSGRNNRKEVFRPMIAMAIAEALVKQKANNNLKSDLNKLITTMATHLAHNHADKREETRNCLVAVVKTVGAEHLSTVIRELRTSLVDGYKPHILAYVLNQLLVKLSLTGDILSTCLSQLLDIIIEDMFGEQAKQKDLKEWTGRIEEVKAKKSGESLCTMVKNVHWEDLLIVLKRIKMQLSKCSEPKWVIFACNALESGLIQRTATPESVPLIYALINMESPLHTEDSNNDWKVQASCYQAIGARWLLYLLKQNSVSENEKAQLLRLLITLVREAKSTLLITSCIKCLTIILRDADVELIGAEKLSILLLQLFNLVVKSDTTKHFELVSASFKLISTLVRDNAIPLGESQLKTLLEYIRSSLESDTQAPIAYDLVKALLRRRVILPEVYQLMSTIRRIILRSFSPMIRNQCRAVYLIFLLDYPLAKNKLEEHLTFFPANLAYEADGGRESVVVFMGQLAEKLPKQVILDVAETWVVALAARLVNETSEKVLCAVKETCSMLVNVLDERMMDRIVSLVERWLAHDNSAIQRTGWVLLPILIRSISVPVTGLINKVLDRLLMLETFNIEMLSVMESIMCRSVTVRACEAVLVLMKMRLDNPIACSIRSRIVSNYFKCIGEALTGVSGHAPLASDLLQWSKSWMRELATMTNSEYDADVLVKNLLFLVQISKDHSYAQMMVDKFERIHRQTTFFVYQSALCKFYAALATSESILLTVELASPMIKALRRILEHQQDNDNEQSHTIAQQTCDILAHQLGNQTYEEIRLSVIRQVSLKKRKKKTKEAQLAIVDPKAFYAKKLRR